VLVLEYSITSQNESIVAVLTIRRARLPNASIKNTPKTAAGIYEQYLHQLKDIYKKKTNSPFVIAKKQEEYGVHV